MKRTTGLYYGKRIIMLVLSILALSIMAFVMSRISPGDPLFSYYGDRVEKMSAEERELAIDRLGLDEPVHVQYTLWLKNALQGDFGMSYKYKTDAIEVIKGRIGNTVLLGGLGFILIFVLALAAGSFCALKENTVLDRVICRLGTISSCIPAFWLSLMLILIFSVYMGIFPSGGAYAMGHSGNLLSRLHYLTLPLAVMVINHVWYYAYMVRNKLLEEVREDYILLVKSKGLTKQKIIWNHCLRNIMPTYISIMAISVPHILGGSYIVEMVFSYPGLGTLSFESAKYHDYNLLMVLCLVTGAAVICFTAIGKIVSEKIDPRLKSTEVTRL